GVVGISGVVIARYVRRQTRATLSEQVEAKGLPLLSVRRAERNASDDERSRLERPAGLRRQNLRDLPIANDPTGGGAPLFAKRQVPNAARDKSMPLIGRGTGTICCNVELVENVEPAEGAFIASSAAVAGAGHVFHFCQRIRNVEFMAFREPL